MNSTGVRPDEGAVPPGGFRLYDNAGVTRAEPVRSLRWWTTALQQGDLTTQGREQGE